MMQVETSVLQLGTHHSGCSLFQAQHAQRVVRHDAVLLQHLGIGLLNRRVWRQASTDMIPLHHVQ